MNILFVCRHNRFRSRFAEAYFKKINKNKSINVKSAGIFPGKYPLAKNQVKVAKDLGINIDGKPKPITTALLRWNDLIVLITDDLPNAKELFNYAGFKNKVVQWKIKDSPRNETTKIETALLKVKKKVEQLNEKLK